jgi:hypothetical protein
MNRLAKLTLPTLLALTVYVLAAAQNPNLTNAKVEEVSATAGLKAAVDGVIQNHDAPLWIGYKIPTTAKDRSMCCDDSWAAPKNGAQRSSGCRVEFARGISMNDSGAACSPPEAPPYAFMFLRTGDQGDKRIREVRVYSAGCLLDFSGLSLFWVNDVKPEQSIELLTGLASANYDAEQERREPGHAAVMAIALHDSMAADTALEKLIQPGQPSGLRNNVAFWLGVGRGKRGEELLRKYVKGDSDVIFREKGTFALSQSKAPEALTDLIDMARHDASSRVRGQAIFWLAQIGGRKEAEQITAAIEDDPESEVKKKAVFALSQMHDGEGVPLLIQLARTNSNPVVRKQAIFWLGQSHDPRALDFLEEILTK